MIGRLVRAPTQPSATRRVTFVALVFLALPMVASPHARQPVDAVAAVLAVLLLLAGYRAPRIALGIALPAALAFSATLERPTSLLPASVALLFLVSLNATRREAIIAGVISVVVVCTLAAILVPDKFFGPPLLAALAWPALAVAAGDAVRSRRATVAAAEERARRAEAERESETRRRVVEERLRIARELHDVVAHRMAVINVQAGVAAHLLHEQPDSAEEALGVVRNSAATVLDELASLLNVLRTAEDAEAPVEPVPTIDAFPALIASFETAGLEVHWDSSGRPRPVNESVQLAAYRLVQEGLTNAHKYGDGRAHLTTTYRDDGLTLVVENATQRTGPEPAATGFGLLGMRERVIAAGGSLTTGAEDGVFRVCANLPTLKEPA